MAQSHAMMYMTAPGRDVARRITDELLSRRLIACANLFEVVSSYWWGARIVRGTETVAVMKTRRALVPQAIATAKQLHPDEVPCIVAYPMTAGFRPYLRWITRETSAPLLRSRTRTSRATRTAAPRRPSSVRGRRRSTRR